MSLDAMKLALGALEEIADEVFSPYDNKLGDAITTLRAAIEQAQEPVAWLVQYPNKHEFVWGERPQWIAGAIGIEPLYTTPRQWQGLTDEEIGLLTTNDKWSHIETPVLALFARAIEAKLKEKNT